MKNVLPFLLVLVAVLAPATNALAQESEEVLQLEIQVAKLRAEVARLNAMVMELRERVKMIERMISEHPDAPPSVDPPEEEVPDPVVRPTPTIPFGLGGSAAGTYVLDKEHLEQMAVKEMKKEMGAATGVGGQTPEEQEEMMKSILQMIKVQISMMNLDIILDSGGTFSVDGLMGGETVNAAGTWTQAGNKVTFTTTHEDGVVKEEPEVKTATYENGVLLLRPDADMPFDLRLIKK